MFYCLPVSGIRMVSDHIADGEKGWMALVKAETRDRYGKLKQFLSYEKRLFFRHFSKTLGR